MTNLYEHGLWSLYSALPSLYSNPWRGQVFPLILFTSLSLHSQSPRTQQQQPSAPSSTNNNKASQVEHYYVLLSPTPYGLHLYSSPALQPLPHTGDGTHPQPVPSYSAMHVWVVTTSINPLINVQSGLLPPECLWQHCCVGSVLPVWTERERFTHGAHSHPWQPSFESSTFTVHHNYSTHMEKKKELHLTRPVCGEPDTLQQRGFFCILLYTWECYSNCESCEFEAGWWEISAAHIQMLSLQTLFHGASPHHVLQPF